MINPEIKQNELLFSYMIVCVAELVKYHYNIYFIQISKCLQDIFLVYTLFR